jgi:uncharacterized protein YfaS (alpha-2-macroglobulin family)
MTQDMWKNASEMLVFAEDVARSKPAQGVRVLVAGANPDGVPTVREATTGDDGTARLALADFADGGVSVLAVRAGHVAAAGSAARNPVANAARQPRGGVYADRPAYRPGERVHWRAVLREVVEGRFGFEPGKLYDVAISDAQGRVASTRKLALSPFGTLAADYVLDELAAVGEWRIACSTPNGPTFLGGFQVQQFELPKVELELATPRAIYYRGERVDVAASARFYWGEPVANAKLAARLPDGRVLELVTDVHGKAEFGFETRDFASEAALELSATAAGRSRWCRSTSSRPTRSPARPTSRSRSRRAATTCCGRRASTASATPSPRSGASESPATTTPSGCAGSSSRTSWRSARRRR